ncbi:Phosphoenolpyruvate carboxylase kinase 1 (AtPPCK1) [Durusdinium trenchii]|uniref:Phosphoenolpyruvate carboxylase kinase 1 (AtPPCK1) n=1 Tax=Durusdinium trenchii TaxID=1381693 RepID=A0ABP0J857_9DINO
MLRAGQGHPNIVRFHGLWADSTPSEQSKGGKQWYMVMDYFKCDLFLAFLLLLQVLKLAFLTEVLTDFGIACLVTEQEELKRVVGTVGYAAPEMLAGTATSFEADEFGAGIVLYFMLSKSTPFLAPTTAKTIEKTMEGKVNLRYGCFDHISEHCRTMIYGLICKARVGQCQESRRLSVSEIGSV